ncbi:MAG TPA: hypothetical protein VIV57_26385 [Anaeromyxobacter sp.]
MDPRVTRVRFDPKTGRELMAGFVLGGRYGPARVPRGVAPEVVLDLLRDALGPETEPPDVAKALEAARFYELPEAVPFFARVRERLESADDLRRWAHALQAAGDLGGTEARAEAAAALDARLVPFPAATGELPLLLATRLALAPQGNARALTARIRSAVAEAKVHEEKDEASMMAFDRLDAVERNDLPRTVALSEAKAKLLAATGPQRAVGLVDAYLQKGAAGGPYVETWSARMLRHDAWRDPAPVADALGRALDAADPEKIGRLADFQAVRAAQAILYLGGALDPARRARYQKALPTGAAMNFLWDDP